jgi:hypothetical protein
MRIAESNASYFLSAILSSRSAVVKEETTLKQEETTLKQEETTLKQEETTLKQEETSKLNTLTVASNGNDSKTESRKRKKKKVARSVEETHTDNVTSSSDCMVTRDSSQVSRQSEEIGEPISRKKKIKNKSGIIL